MNYRLILIFIFISVSTIKKSQAQTKEELWSISPVNQFGFSYGRGRLSSYNYEDTLGKSYFTPYRNHNFNISFSYGRLISNKIKLSTGLSINFMETSHLLSFDTAQVPGSGKYINEKHYYSGVYAFGSVPYDYSYTIIPLYLDFMLADIHNRHQFWIGAGANFSFFHNIIYGTSSGIGYQDSLTFPLFNIESTYGIKSFITMPSLRFYYTYYITPVQQICIGFSARYNSVNIMEGVYKFMPELPQSYAAGKVSNTFSYIGMTFGYSFNNRKHNYLKNNSLLHSKKLFPDKNEQIPDKNEIVPWFNLFTSNFFPNKTPDGIRAYNPSSKLTRTMMLGAFFKKYLNNNYSWEAGFRIDGTAIGSPNTFIAQTVFIADIPTGINKQFKLSKRWNMEAGLNIYPFINIYDPTGRTYTNNYNSAGVIVFSDTFDIYSYNLIGFGFNPNLRFSFDLKNRNKLYILLQYNIDAVKSFDMNYYMSQNGSGYYHGFYTYRRNFLNLSFGYGFTGKLHRWRKHNSN